MFYCWARDAALSVTNKIMEPNAVILEVKVCTAALRLMLQILNWEFRSDPTSMKAGIDVFSAGVRHDNASSKRSECVLVQVCYLEYLIFALLAHTCTHLNFETFHFYIFMEDNTNALASVILWRLPNRRIP